MAEPTFNPFVQASREELFIKMGISAASGAGKTLTALKLAKYLSRTNDGKRNYIALGDSESGRASKYAGQPDVPQFDTVFIGPNSPYKEFRTYHPVETYVKLITLAEDLGYDVLVLDSLSHAWVGSPGGTFDIKESHTRGKDERSGWRVATPIFDKLMEKIIGCQIHLICTLRAKQDYFRDEKKEGGLPSRTGLDPIFRPDKEYDFDFWTEMDLAHNLYVVKGYDLTDKRYNKPGEDFANDILDWLRGGSRDYVYGNGMPVPNHPTTRRIFNEYRTAVGSVAESKEALQSWHTANQERTEAPINVGDSTE